MQYFLVVQVVDGECDLCEPIQDLTLSKILALFLHLLDTGVHIAQLTIDHNDAEVAFLISEGILIRHDVDMS